MGQQRFQRNNGNARPCPGQDAAAAAEQQDGAHNGHRQDHGRHMRFQKKQAQYRDHPEHRPDQLPPDPYINPFPHAQFFAGLPPEPRCVRCQVRCEQDHLKLCQFRSLQRQERQRDPALTAVDGRHGQGNHQQCQYDEITWPHQLAQEPVVHIAHNEHRHNANQQKDRLLAGKIKTAAFAQIARGIAGTEQHHDAEHQDHAQREQPVDEQRRPRPRVLLKDCHRRLLFFAVGCHRRATPLSPKNQFSAPGAWRAAARTRSIRRWYKKYSLR